MGFIKVTIIDRINWNCRTHESFWQYKLETFAPRGLNIRLAAPSPVLSSDPSIELHF